MNFEDQELQHDLFLTKRQTTKMRSVLLAICKQMQNSVRLKHLK